MKTDCKGCFGAANNDCESCEEECGQEVFFTDLTPYFTKDIKDGVLTGAWIIEEGEQKELILKFNEHISGIGKIVYLQLIGQNLIETAAREDETGEEDTSFRELLDGIRIRQWEESDEERIRRGIQHIITK